MIRKILFIDDYEDIAEELARGMERYGYESYYTNSAREALQRFEEINPDLVVSDIRMPKMNGFKLAEKLREKGATCPIIFLSAYSFNEEEMERVGVLECLEKPFFNHEKIHEKIREYECGLS